MCIPTVEVCLLYVVRCGTQFKTRLLAVSYSAQVFQKIKNNMALLRLAVAESMNHQASIEQLNSRRKANAQLSEECKSGRRIDVWA